LRAADVVAVAGVAVVAAAAADEVTPAAVDAVTVVAMAEVTAEVTVMAAESTWRLAAIGSPACESARTEI
jgi:hypothetical protein